MRPWSASEAAHRTPPGSSALREAKRQRQMFSVAKAKRQLQSTQSERRSPLVLKKGYTF